MTFEETAAAAGASLRERTSGIERPEITAVRANRRLRGGLAVVLLAFAGTLAVVGATAVWPSPDGSIAVSAVPTSTTAPAPQTSTTPPTSTSTPESTTIPTAPTSTTTPVAVPAEGPLFGETLGLALIFDDGIDGILAIDPDRRIGSRSVIDGQRAGDAPYRLTRVGDHLVVGWGLIHAAEVGSRESINIGEATIYLPAVEPGVVWLIDYSGGRIGQGTPLAWQVDMTGNQITEPRAINAERLPAIGVPGGLALEATSGVVVWHAATGGVTHRLGTGSGFISDAAGSLLAWCIDECLELHITDLDSRRDVVILSPADTDGISQWQPFEARAARFSPDGQLLAAQSGSRIVLINTSTGEMNTIAELPTDDPGYFVTWSPDGTQLFASSYSYGESSTTVLRYNLVDQTTTVATLPFGGALSLIVTDADEATPYLRDQDQEPSNCPPVTSYPSGRDGICGFRF